MLQLGLYHRIYRHYEYTAIKLPRHKIYLMNRKNLSKHIFSTTKVTIFQIRITGNTLSSKEDIQKENKAPKGYTKEQLVSACQIGGDIPPFVRLTTHY